MSQSLSGNIKLSLERETAAELEGLLDELVMKERDKSSCDWSRLRWMEQVQTSLAQRLRPHKFKDNYCISTGKKK